MSKHQTTAHDTGATSLSRDSRELRDDELDTVIGGVIESMSLSFTKVMFTPAPTTADPPAKHWFNGG